MNVHDSEMEGAQSRKDLFLIALHTAIRMALEKAKPKSRGRFGTNSDTQSMTHLQMSHMGQE